MADYRYQGKREFVSDGASIRLSATVEGWGHPCESTFYRLNVYNEERGMFLVYCECFDTVDESLTKLGEFGEWKEIN